MMGHKKGLHLVTWTLVMIGGLNWLLVGAMKWDLVAKIFGSMDMTGARVVYVIIGLCAVYEIFTHGTRCRECKPDGSMGNSQPQ